MRTLTTQAYQLSPQQKRLWLLCRNDSDGVYGTVCIVEARGRLDYEKLKLAIQTVVDRHEILRTRFELPIGMSAPVQVIADRGEPEVGFLDLTGARQDEQMEKITGLWDRARRMVANYKHDHALNVDIVKIGETWHKLVVAIPALCSDQRTLRNLVREIAHNYASKGHRVEGDLSQYTRFSQWQIELLAEETPDSAPKYRKDDIALYDQRLPLEERTEMPPDFTPGSSRIEIGRPQLERLDSIAREHGLSIPVALLSLWQLLLFRVTGQAEQIIGVKFDVRKYSELQNALGLFAQYVPVRFQVNGFDTFTELLMRTSKTLKHAAAFEEYFAWPGRSDEDELETPYCPLAYEYNYDEEPPYFGSDVSFEISHQYVCVDRFNLKLNCLSQNDGLRVDLYYNRALFNRRTVRRMVSQFQTLLEGVAAADDSSEKAPRSVDDFELLCEEEKRRILEDWNETGTDYPGLSLQELFEERVKTSPDAIAVVFNQELVTYDRLNKRANQLARYLRRLGAGPDRIVGVCLDKSIDMIIGLLGILKAGAAYLPLDPTLPKARLKVMIEDSGCAMALGAFGTIDKISIEDLDVIEIDSIRQIIAAEGEENFPPLALKDNIAYVIFTSGSTGRPKGVTVPHRGLSNYLSWCAKAYGPDDGIGSPVQSSIGFDLTVTSIFPPLLAGRSIFLFSDQHAMGTLESMSKDRLGYSLIKITPTHLEVLTELVDESGAGDLARVLVVGGEALSGEVVKKWLEKAPNTKIINEYGPTETTVGSCVYQVAGSPKKDVPIGRPIDNTKIYVLNRNYRPAPVGTSGEIYIGGEGVARGYVNQPEQTADRFVPSPFGKSPGARIYKTGDSARLLENLSLEFLGRIDDQVKIRGYRIEPFEIESALRNYAGVSSATVMVREAVPGDKRLVAYVVPGRRFATTVDGVARYKLANNLAIAHLNKRETDFLYEEIFESQMYLKHGINIADGDCVVDVGSNIGLFLLFAHLKHRNLNVYAFEPNPYAFNALRLNTSLYEVEAKLYALSLSSERRTSKVSFSSEFSFSHCLNTGVGSDLDEGAGAGFVGLFEGQLDDQPWGRAFNVEMKPLSAIIREEGIERINLLKITVQDGELDVIAGIEEPDWRKIDQVMMIVNDGSRLEEACGRFRKQGFDVAVEQNWLLEKRGKTIHYLYAGRRSAAQSSNDRADRSIPVVEDTILSAGKLMGYLKERLPEYMIPSAIVLLDSLPLSPSGKVNRKELPSPEEADLASANTFVAPATVVEQVLAGIWSEVLLINQIGLYDNFFELGGHSLLASNLISKISQVFKLTLPMRAFFETPTLAGLAEKIEKATRADQGLESPPIQPVPRNIELPLSFAQQRLWFVDQLEPGNAAYNSPVAVRVRGPLNTQALEQTLTEVVRRHESLRTVIVSTNGRPRQEIRPWKEVRLPVINLQATDEAEMEAEVLRMALAEAEKPFHLHEGSLWRATLLKMTDEDHVFLLTLHHIVSDGWSMDILVGDVVNLYRTISDGNPPSLPDLELQYADFAHWQREWLKGESLDLLVNYWREKLGNKIPMLTLPADRVPAEAGAYSGSRHVLTFSKGTRQALQSFSRQESVTMFMVVLGAFQLMLHHYSDQNDIPVNASIANRTRPETQNIVGFFVNTLILYTDLSGDPTIREFLARVREVTLEAQAHQDLPFEKLVEVLSPTRSSSGRLSRAKINWQNARNQVLTTSGLNLRHLEIDYNTLREDLLLNLAEDRDELYGSLDYNTELFDASTVAMMARHLNLVLRTFLFAPETRLGAVREIIREADRQHQNKEEKEMKSKNLQRLQNVKRRTIQVS
jgi:amino acid adenylation domain-containing protein/FkbM family methyltransferase